MGRLRPNPKRKWESKDQSGAMSKKHTKKNGNYSKTLGKLQRQKKVADMLVLNPKPVAKIAEILGVSARTIYNDIDDIERKLHKETKESAFLAKQKVVQRLEYALGEAREAYEKSKMPQLTQKNREKKTTAGKTGGAVEEETNNQIRHQPGDPRFLEQYVDIATKLADYEGVEKASDSKDINVKIEMPELPEELKRFGLGGKAKALYDPNVQDAELIDDDEQQPTNQQEEE